MFKSRSPFYPPSVPGVTSYPPRGEDESKMRRGRREMSIEEPVEVQQVKSKELPLHSTQTLTSTSIPIIDEKFCFELTKPYEVNGQAVESDLYWWYEVTNQVSNEHLRKIVFREQQYFVRSDGLDIYQTIFIGIDGVQGFKDEKGIFTSKVCALHLTAVSSFVDDTGSTVYDLLYKQTQDAAWDLPMSLGEIKFRIFCDEEKRSGALGVPLICQFDIRHIAR